MTNKLSIRQIKCLFTAFLSVAMSLVAMSANGQNVSVTIHMDNVPIRDVMAEIETQTKYLFLYTDEIDTNRIVSVNADARPLQDVLRSVLGGTDTAFRITASNIVLSKREPEVAPQPRNVSGLVLGVDGEPIIGATVIIEGTSIGATTGINGDYHIAVPPHATDPKISVSYLGYDPQTVAIGARTSVDFTLTQQTQQIDRVVVTALGIKRSEKALSYNVQQVNTDDVLANKDANFLNSLSGKVAGVNINSSSSGVGGASRVVMRGAKSISGSSNALYVIDGVPMLSSPRGTGDEFDSRGQTDPMADINPEDIESISVLTGAAAAALYGSDAANGAIVVTTKKGAAERLSVTVSSSTEIMTPFVLPRFQNRYGTGDLSSAGGSTERSWGRLLNGANTIGYDPRKDYFQMGVSGNENVSLSTGTERNQTYLSLGALNSKGIVPNNTYDRYNFNFRNTSNFFKDRITLDVTATYVLQEDRNVTNQGEYNNPVVSAYLYPRGNNWEDIKLYERYNPVRKVYEQYWPGVSSMNMQNPYWINYRNLRESHKDRYMLGAAMSFDILDWLNVSGRIRYDDTHGEYTRKFYSTTITTLTAGSSYGFFGLEKSRDRQIYGDAFININKTWKDWSLSVNVGGSFNDHKYSALSVDGPIADGSTTFGDETQGLTNVFSLQNISTTRSNKNQDGYRIQEQSVMGQAEVGFKGTYYLTVTGRNDWPSALAGPYSHQSSFFYPSVGLSVLVSNWMPRMEHLSYMKVRASWASVGVAFEKWIGNPMFEKENGVYTTPMTFLNKDLKPERTESWEVGLTMRFAKHFNFDFTWYNTHTRNQTIPVEISSSAGSDKVYIQSGDILNTGVELALGYDNTWGKFSWATNYTFSTNKNKIISMVDSFTNPETGENEKFTHVDMKGLGQAHFILKEGGTLGDLYSLIDLKRDSNGAIYVDAAGNIQTEGITELGEYVKLGSVLPKANMAWRNDFKIGGFNFGFMISARLGGIVFSRTQAVLDYYGVSEASASARDNQAAGNYITINGGTHIDANKWFTIVAGGTAIPQYYTYSATNVRLQEASVGYTIPRKVLKDVCEINISVVGRNLWMIYNKAPFDPEATSKTDNNYYQGIDYFMMPSLRNIGFNLRVKF